MLQLQTLYFRMIKLGDNHKRSGRIIYFYAKIAYGHFPAYCLFRLFVLYRFKSSATHSTHSSMLSVRRLGYGRVMWMSGSMPFLPKT